MHAALSLKGVSASSGRAVCAASGLRAESDSGVASSRLPGSSDVQKKASGGPSAESERLVTQGRDAKSPPNPLLNPVSCSNANLALGCFKRLWCYTLLPPGKSKEEKTISGLAPLVQCLTSGFDFLLLHSDLLGTSECLSAAESLKNI